MNDIVNALPARVIWLTGIPGAGKSTIARQIKARLHMLGRHSHVLDGDELRQGLNRDLGFTEADRLESSRRVAEVAKIMADAGLMVIVALVSPLRRARELARSIIGPARFLEIYVDTPLAIAEARDPKNLYAKARRGEITHFTGITAAYEAPLHPALRLDGSATPPEALAEQVIEALRVTSCQNTGG